MAERRPAIAVHNRQRKIAVDAASLQDFANAALQAVLALQPQARGELQKLAQVNVMLVSDRRIAALHKKFMGIAGPTDVITFREGDIFISTETARRQARTFRTSPSDELKLYVLHGLLHLHGFDDRTARAAQQMHATQSRLFDRLTGRRAG